MSLDPAAIEVSTVEELKRLIHESLQETKFLIDALTRGRAADHDILIELRGDFKRVSHTIDDHEHRLREIEEQGNTSARLTNLERIVKRHERLFWWGAGAAAVVGGLLATLLTLLTQHLTKT